MCKKPGITVVRTNFQHNDMRDTGPDEAKASIDTMLDQFLENTDNSEVAPVDTKSPEPVAAGPVALVVAGEGLTFNGWADLHRRRGPVSAAH